MNLENYATMKALQNVNSTNMEDFLDGSVGDEIREKFLTKRLQFDTSENLYSKVENVCMLLGCSKRVFLEMVVFEGVEKAKTVFFSTYQNATGEDFSKANGA